MGFIHKKKKIFGEVIQQSTRLASWRTPGQHTGIVLNPFTEANLGKHFHIILGTLSDTLGFNQFSIRFKKLYPLLHLRFNFFDRALHFFPRHNVVRRRIDCDMLKFRFKFPR